MLVSGSFLSNNDKYIEISKLNNSNVDFIHVDVMDGHFVNKKFIKPKELSEIINYCKKPIDIHLMVNHPNYYLKQIKNISNISYITVHYEIKNIDKYITKIKNMGIKVGISIKPDTEIEKIYCLLDKLDLVLIMSVNPGYSGQKFIYSSEDKINKLKTEIIKRKLNTKISVDGGINKEVLDKVQNADILVSASYILDNLDNIDLLKNNTK